MLRICQDSEDLSDQAAALFVAEAGEAIKQKGAFRVALSGGTTPKRLYEKLAAPKLANKIDWSRVFLFWGDERFVPNDDPLSNYAMTKTALLSHVPLPEGNIFPIPFAETVEAAAFAYEVTLRAAFGGLPRFDLTLLGLGADGHTASLFPGTAALAEVSQWTAPAKPLSGGPVRVTLTYPVLNASALVCFLVAGADKASMVAAILEGPHGRYPAQGVQPMSGRLLWLLDQAAAGELTS